MKLTSTLIHQKPTWLTNLAEHRYFLIKFFGGLTLFFLICHLHVVQLEDMKMDEASEEVAVQLTAQGVIGKRVDEMESGFMMALDYMIQLAEKDQDDKVLI